jgi:predicted DNA-binding protein
MATKKISITVEPLFLKRLDQWAKKMGRSRSRFILEEIDKRLRKLEDEEITRIYNEAYSDTEMIDQDREIAEEMLGISAIHDEEEKW